MPCNGTAALAYVSAEPFQICDVAPTLELVGGEGGNFRTAVDDIIHSARH